VRNVADNCDLSLTIDDTGYKATPMTFAGFAFMWTGARSTYGVKQGKVCFQVKVRIQRYQGFKKSLTLWILLGYVRVFKKAPFDGFWGFCGP